MNFFERAKKIRDERYRKEMDSFDAQNPEPKAEARRKQSDKLMNVSKQFLSAAGSSYAEPKMQAMADVKPTVTNLTSGFSNPFGGFRNKYRG